MLIAMMTVAGKKEARFRALTLSFELQALARTPKRPVTLQPPAHAGRGSSHVASTEAV